VIVVVAWWRRHCGGEYDSGNDNDNNMDHGRIEMNEAT